MVTPRLSLQKLIAGTTTRANIFTYWNENADILDNIGSFNNYSGGAVDPTTTNDSSEGYSIGSQWFTTNAIWECTDATENAAIWRPIWEKTGPYIIDHAAGSTQNIILLPTQCYIQDILIICNESAPTRTLEIGYVGDTAKILTDNDIPKVANTNYHIINPIEDIFSTQTQLIATLGGSGNGNWNIWVKFVRYDL